MASAPHFSAVKVHQSFKYTFVGSPLYMGVARCMPPPLLSTSMCERKTLSQSQVVLSGSFAFIHGCRK